MPALRVASAILVFCVLALACSGEDSPAPSPTDPGPGGVDPASLAGEVPSFDLYVGAPQRVTVGLYSSSGEGGIIPVTSGEIDLAIAPYEDGAGTAVETTARFLPAPGTAGGEEAPTLEGAAGSRGVYEAEDVTFDEPGIWQATATFTLDGGGPYVVETTPFQVQRTPTLPAPGDPALKTANLTLTSEAPPEAIDSRATNGRPIPDAELHRTTIASSLRAQHPIVAIFATPAYCTSLFCGPVTDAVQDLAAKYSDRADFIHVEIFKKVSSEKRVINQAAADWLLRNDDLVEPWLFLIDDEGTILDRWGPLFDPRELADRLAAMPVLDS